MPQLSLPDGRRLHYLDEGSGTAGHLSSLENPAAFTAALEAFLKT